MKEEINHQTGAEPTFKQKNRGGFAFSLTLIIAGTIFLLVNTGIIPTAYKSVLTEWPIWLLLVGLFCVFHRNHTTGIILLVVGGFFITPALGTVNPSWGIPENFTHVYWPLLLILAGLLILFLKAGKYKGFLYVGGTCKPTSSFESEDGNLHIETTFDSRKNIVLDPVFKGGDIRCSFGEVEIDLRKTSLPEGTTKLYIDVSFGSVVVIVPDTWNVQIKGSSAFGSFTDHRLTKAFYPNETKRLIVEGKVAFGECELRD